MKKSPPTLGALKTSMSAYRQETMAKNGRKNHQRSHEKQKERNDKAESQSVGNSWV
jgi:hypothetical protein